jgi:membrane protease YdiL (CAAX protease family)
MSGVLRSRPLHLFFILAFALSWGSIGLGLIDRFHFWVPILGAFAPAVAAIVVAGFSAGEGEARALLKRLGGWRVGFAWCLVALGLPLAEDLFAAGLASVNGAFSAARIPGGLPVLPAMWVVFVLAAGEELGWRGFALPRLLVARSGVPLLPYSVSVVFESVVFTWIVRNTRGSVLMATLFHGSSNLGMILYDGIDPAWAPWLKCSTSTLVALGVLAWAGPDLTWERPRASIGEPAR